MTFSFPFMPPMMAVSGEPPTGPDWAYEIKWDGMRVLAALTGGRTELRGRSASDFSSTFPELADLAREVGSSKSEPTLLDGEVTAFVNGKPSFRQLQHRLHVTEPTVQLIQDVPVVYMVFDLLRLDGNSVFELDYRTRRKYLQEVVPDCPYWKVPAYADGDHQPPMHLASQLELEGLVAKRLDSSYRPGTRSRSWLKIKNTQRQEFVIAGWLEGEGELRGQIGSLALGTWQDGELVFAGLVGSGLTTALRNELNADFSERSKCPFRSLPDLHRPVHWVRTRFSAEVKYLDWKQGGRLRHPSLLGLRVDKDPKSIAREPPNRL